MSIDYLNFKKKFDDEGYFVLKNFVKESFISHLVDEINNSSNTVKYFDNSKNLRRFGLNPSYFQISANKRAKRGLQFQEFFKQLLIGN